MQIYLTHLFSGTGSGSKLESYKEGATNAAVVAR